MSARILFLTMLLVCAPTAFAGATPQQELDDAARNNRLAFVLVSEPGVAGTAEARGQIQQAISQVNQSVLVELDRKDPANSALMSRFRIVGVPVPLVLLVAPNGAVAAGFRGEDATSEGLAAAVPSPKKAEVLKALQEGKPVFVVAAPRAGGTSPAAVDACVSACVAMAQNGMVVKIDMDDRAEEAFLTQLKINRSSLDPVILVLNSQGQITGMFNGPTDVGLLVDTAKKKLGGCCPPNVAGSSKACPPPKSN